jgi:serine/threonine-protein kinase TTK/MPS1
MDDSDDEGNVPQLSALARMLLEESPEKNAIQDDKKDEEHNALEEKRRSPLSRYAASRKRINWSQSPDLEERSTRTGLSYAIVQKNTSREGSPELPSGQEFVTPAVGRYSRRILGGTQAKEEPLTSSGSSGDTYEDVETKYTTAGYASIVRPTPGVTGGLPPSTTASAMRWKRPGRGLLGAVGGAPRRGPRRESDQSREDDQREGDIQEQNSSSPEESHHNRQQSDEIVSQSKATPPREEQHAIPEENPLATISRRPRRASPESLSDHNKMDIYHSTTPESGSGSSRPSDRSSPSSIESNKPSLSRAAAIAATAAAAPQHTSKPDKENMPPPPPTFRRPTLATSSYKRLDPTTDEKPPVFQAPLSPIRSSSNKPLVASPMKKSPEKRVLSSKTTNTPRRPAPPPPKMSMLQTVTATAGAATTTAAQNARRNRSTVHINGKPYRRLDSIGKGGSCKVYKVMAENHKMFAMKKVTFHEGDGEAAILGYKGEIDLLKKLSGEERVIRLYDYEMNDEKKTLTMVLPPCIPSYLKYR